MKVDWKTLVTMLGPVVLANVPHGEKIAPLVPTIVHGISEAEDLKSEKSGAERRAHVLALALDAAAITNQVKGRVLLDPDALQVAVGHGIDAVVGTVNVVHGAHKQVGILLPSSAEALGAPAGSIGE